MAYKDRQKQIKADKAYYHNNKKDIKKKSLEQRKENLDRSQWAKMRDSLSLKDFKKWSKARLRILANLKRNKKWNFIKTWMVSNACSCGENRIKKLTFHHINPDEKKRSIYNMSGYSRHKILDELLRGVVKCKNCHTIIHNGTPEGHEQKLINKYIKSRPNKRHKHKNRLLIWYFKQTQKCLKCGMNNPICLLFHHVDSSTKKYKIAYMFEKGRDKISDELSKTICLCQNCHEEFHAIYGLKTNQQNLEIYLDKPIILHNIDITKYLIKLPFLY